LLSHLFLAERSAFVLSQETEPEPKNNGEAKNNMFLDVAKRDIGKVGIVLVELVAMKIIVRIPA